MPRPNIEEETKRFKERLENGEFKVDLSVNSEEKYSLSKLKRDTEAIIKFTESRLFSDILNIV